jgi:DMSO/TMAO reductase YedYZ molybdopterin-dependent catalytic subunit
MPIFKNPCRLVLSVLCMASAVSPVCARSREKAKGQNAEIREYKGEKLDSINKFEENSIKGPQRVDLRTYRLRIGGLVDKPASYTYEEILSRPAVSKIITVHCVEGWDVKVLWQGVTLPDLLREAGVKPGANTVIFKSVDGYSTSLPLADVLNRNMLLAYRMNGLTLPPERGFPFELAAEGKWGYKWAKWVASIELSDNPNFRGTWESRGYNNNGDLSGPMYEKKP